MYQFCKSVVSTKTAGVLELRAFIIVYDQKNIVYSVLSNLKPLDDHLKFACNMVNNQNIVCAGIALNSAQTSLNIVLTLQETSTVNTAIDMNQVSYIV